MNFSANRNPYEESLRMVWDLFGAHVSGKPGGLFCVVSTSTLGPVAANALESSAAALGFGAGSCCYITLKAEDTQLGANDVRMLIEGIDPSVLVATDAQTASALSYAYNCEVPTNSSSRALGRTVVAFKDMESLLDTPANKQKAWALLKHLKA